MRTGARPRDAGRSRFGKQVGDPRDARGLYVAMRRFIEHRGVQGGTESSLYNLERYILPVIGAVQWNSLASDDTMVLPLVQEATANLASETDRRGYHRRYCGWWRKPFPWR